MGVFSRDVVRCRDRAPAISSAEHLQSPLTSPASSDIACRCRALTMWSLSHSAQMPRPSTLSRCAPPAFPLTPLFIGLIFSFASPRFEPTAAFFPTHYCSQHTSKAKGRAALTLRKEVPKNFQGMHKPFSAPSAHSGGASARDKERRVLFSPSRFSPPSALLPGPSSPLPQP